MEEYTLHINDTMNLIFKYLYSNAATSNHVKIRCEKLMKILQEVSGKEIWDGNQNEKRTIFIKWPH